MKQFVSTIFLLSGTFVFTLSAQTPTPTPIEENEVVVISSNLIQIDAAVTDKNGKPVADLKAEDFEIYENGEKQEITAFSFVSVASPNTATENKENAKSDRLKNSNAPPVPPVRLRPEQVRRTIALVVDDLGLSFESTAYVRGALKKFVDEQMQPNDLIAIIRTGGGIGALQSFTSDKRQLYAAIEKVRWNPSGRAGIAAFAPIEQTFDEMVEQAKGESGGEDDAEEKMTKRNSSVAGDVETLRQDVFAVGTLGALNFIVKGMNQLPGRKSVVLFSDGFRIFNRLSDGGSDQNLRILNALRRLTDLANRASVVVNTVDARGLQTLGLTAADNPSGLTGDQIEQRLTDRRNELFDTQEGLNYLAQQTGGRAFRNNNDISGAIEKVLDDQKSYYLLGYQPDGETFDPKTRRYNKLVVKLKRPDLRVRYRSGFFGINESEERAATMNTSRIQQLYSALSSPFASGEIELRMISLFGNTHQQGSFMRSMIHVKGDDLKFVAEKDGWHRATFDILAITFGDNGSVIGQVNRTENIRARTEALEDIKKYGFVYNLLVETKKPGAYQLRVALRDAETARTGSANQFVEVPNLQKKRLALSGIILDNFKLQGERETENELDSQTDTSRRRFQTGTGLSFAFVVYNAKPNPASNNQPNLFLQYKLFRDGKEIFASKESVIEINGQTDFARIAASRALSLAKNMQPGEYVLQITIKDAAAKDKRNTATQWIDFEITN
jgi:VWFA-related protein